MLVDPHHPFFDRLWVRVLSVVVPLGWAGLEWWQGEGLWAAAFAAAAAVLAHALFIRRNRPDPGDRDR